MPTLTTRRGELPLPVFVPDATRGTIRGVPSRLLPAHGVEALLVSTAHLALQPGASVVKAAGGIHSFMAWNGPVISDSGGYQIYSLLSGQSGLGSVARAGFSYRFSRQDRFRRLTPGRCIDLQLRLGADVVYCLDYCTHPGAPADRQEQSVDFTIRWAAEGRAAFDRAVADLPPAQRPLLFAVIQGGADKDRRARCAEALADIGFDGYGYGGYPVADGRLVAEVGLVAQLTPPGTVRHALGIGTPENLVNAWRAGYHIFDCALPTRNARRGVLYTGLDTSALGTATEPAAPPPGFYRIARLSDERWVRENGPVDPGCDCEMCTSLPAAYLAHLFRASDASVNLLASLHNLRFYARLTEALRALPAPDRP